MDVAAVLGQIMKKLSTTRRTLTFLALAAAVQLLIAATALAQTTSTIIVSGLGGNPEYDEQFMQFGDTLAESAKQLIDDEADVVLLQGEQATKQAILDAISQQQQRAAEDSVKIFLLGHGSFDGNEYKFNIPGPDLTGTELIEALNELPESQQLLVLATSASGALFEPLQAAHRVVITATKNGRERNAVKFTEHLVTGLADPAADIDKDETISAQELFQYAERAVEKYYENEKLLASEHSRLSGESAATFELARYGSLLVNQTDISEELITQRKEISAQIASLRNQKSDLTEDDYFDRLQTLMLELATVQRAIDTPAVPTGEQTIEQTPGQTPEPTIEQPSEQLDRQTNGQETAQPASSASNTNPAPSADEVTPGAD